MIRGRVLSVAGLLLVVAVLLTGTVPTMAGGRLEGQGSGPYRDFSQTSAAELMLSQLTAFGGGALPSLKAREAFLAETAALLDIIHAYDLNAPPHVTNGWTDFTMAEWPLMNIVYTGLAICNLAVAYPEYRETARTEVRFLLDILKLPAVSGFMTPHFGEPFPKDGPIGRAAVFLHGHYLYLALKYRQTFGLPDEDAWIDKVAAALGAGFGRALVLPSYGSMYFLSDNACGLAALALYDRIFGQTGYQARVKATIDEVSRHYLDPATGLLATYINPAGRTIVTGPRGISCMYALLFLADADPEFARRQWEAARRILITSLADVIGRNRSQLPMADLLLPLVRTYRVCLEFPSGSRGPAGGPGGGDTDSGPVVLGVGTSATGFAIGAAYRMDDPDTAGRIEDLALLFGDPLWKDGKLYYRNMFHPVGQAVVLFGKTTGLLERLNRAP